MQSELVVIEDALLTSAEQKDLDFHERRIEQAEKFMVAAWVTISTSLRLISENRLYRKYGTFDDYCRDRWQKTRRWGHLMIDAAKVIENLRVEGAAEDVNHGSHLLPENERQTRPLTRLEPEQQREAWQKAVDTAPNGKMTAAHVEQVVREWLPDDQNVFIDHEADEYVAIVEEQAAAPLAVHFTSNTPEWYTPMHIILKVIAVLGQIDLDPCSNSHEAPNVPAFQHYTWEDDGINQPWHGRVYMNPPYGDEIGQWTERLRRAYEDSEIAEAIALLPSRTDTKWFEPLYNYALCFVRGRLKFSNAENSAPFPSVVVYLGRDVEGFKEHFGGIGRCGLLQ